MKSVDIIKQSNMKIYITMTGGGTYALSQLLMGGGASHVFIGANIPYSEQELKEIVPVFEKCVSDSVATALAIYSKSKSKDVGVGVTCKLMKDGERAGREHLVCVSISDRFKTITKQFVPKEKCRVSQEIEVGNFILDMLARHTSDTTFE